jgi:hypothetical protein
MKVNKDLKKKIFLDKKFEIFKKIFRFQKIKKNFFFI